MMENKRYLTEVATMATESSEVEMIHYILSGNRTGNKLRHLDAIKLLVLRLRAIFPRRAIGTYSISTLDNQKETTYEIEAIEHLAKYGTCAAILKADGSFTCYQWRHFIVTTWGEYIVANPGCNFDEFVMDLFSVPNEKRCEYSDANQVLVDVLSAAKVLSKPINEYPFHNLYDITQAAIYAEADPHGGTSVKALGNMPESVVSLILIENYDDLYELCFAVEALKTRLFFGLSEK